MTLPVIVAPPAIVGTVTSKVVLVKFVQQQPVGRVRRRWVAEEGERAHRRRDEREPELPAAQRPTCQKVLLAREAVRRRTRAPSARHPQGGAKRAQKVEPQHDGVRHRLLGRHQRDITSTT